MTLCGLSLVSYIIELSNQHMPNIQAVTYSRHAKQHFQHCTSYSFAAQDAIAPLVAQELPRAAIALPIGFIAHEGTFLPVAVQGLRPGTNLFVAPDGRWLGSYVPAVYRGYPFVLANSENGQQVLCIDEDSGLISQTNGSSFFDADAQPSLAIKEILSFLNEVAESRRSTQHTIAVLQKYELIQPWLIKLRSDAGEQAIDGLYSISEERLNQLPPDAFEEARQAGALPVVYSQLLSMQHLPMFSQLSKLRAQAGQPAAPLPTVPNMEFLNQNETISFGNLD